MISFSGSLRVFLAVEPVDMRAGFERLANLVGEVLKEDLRQGALFVFTNRRNSRIKVLCFDGTGLWLLTKRLERGSFAWPKREHVDGGKLNLAPEAFAMLTDPMDEQAVYVAIEKFLTAKLGGVVQTGVSTKVDQRLGQMREAAGILPAGCTVDDDKKD